MSDAGSIPTAATAAPALEEPGEPSAFRRAVEQADSARLRQIATLERLKTTGRRGHRDQILSRPGELAARFAFDPERFPDPVLVTSSVQGDARLRLGMRFQQVSLTAQDVVNTCINQVAAQGATPLFFTASGPGSDPAFAAAGSVGGSGSEPAAELARTPTATLAATLAAALGEACKSNGCAFLELAAADSACARLSGVAVGAGSRERLLLPERVAPGDVLLALPSRALQSSELALAGRLLELSGLRPDRYSNDLGEKPVEALLRPQRSFAGLIRKLLQANVVSNLIPIAGSVNDTLDRALPKATAAHIRLADWPVPSLFRYLTALGDMGGEQAWQLLSMGIGLIACVPPPLLGKAQRLLSQCQEAGFVIGQVQRSHTRSRIDLL